MRTADFHYELPPELVAQFPATERDASRLLVLDRATGAMEHVTFRELRRWLRSGDVLVLNNSRVLPARLRGVNVSTSGAFEVLLLEETAINDWWTMMKPGKRARVGTQIRFAPRADSDLAVCGDILATVTEFNAEGHRRLRFSGTTNLLDALDALGEIPLPPYIRRCPAAPGTASARLENVLHHAGLEIGTSHVNAVRDLDRERYQTVYSQMPGSVAAPTAGLHFTESLLAAIRSQGVEVHFITLHVGLGTFASVKAETLEAHTMHEERFEIGEATARAVNKAKAAGRRVIAVGTTTVRVLESAFGSPPPGVAAASDSPPPEGGTSYQITPGRGRTRIFIYPPRDFRVVDALLTNFHLPCSTLIMLVSAFVAPGSTRGRELVLAAYGEAIRERYRFFSYGDAMLVL